MATKTGLIATINGFLTAIITQAKVRSSASAIVDEIYPKVLTDTHLGTTNVITRVNTNYNYRFKFSKSGRNIAVNGSISNATASSIGSFTFANITTAEYSATPSVNLMGVSDSGQVIRLTINGTTVSYVGTMPPNTTFYFNGIYHAQN